MSRSTDRTPRRWWRPSRSPLSATSARQCRRRWPRAPCVSQRSALLARCLRVVGSSSSAERSLWTGGATLALGPGLGPALGPGVDPALAACAFDARAPVEAGVLGAAPLFGEAGA